MTDKHHIHILDNKNVPPDMFGLRVDQIASQLFADFSREQIKTWIKSGELTVNGATIKAKQRLKGHESIKIDARIEEHSEDLPEDIPLTIIYEDDTVLVINKPAGLVVHPGAGNRTGTLVNGLLFYDASLATLPRAGLVHRIDKDTTGLLVIAKNSLAQQHLSAQLQEKSVFRHYLCVVVGEIIQNGMVDAPIKRHPQERTKMSVQTGGRDAISHYEVQQKLPGYTMLSVALETGRTHQIRVHMAHIGHPLVGDPTYGGRKQLSAKVSENAKKFIMNFNRQALHAYELGFIHPKTGEEMLFEAPVPADMVDLIELLENEA